ncbi:hypothetical protein HDU76_002494, partial [Blyttiomyces sp. JEL0837]
MSPHPPHRHHHRSTNNNITDTAVSVEEANANVITYKDRSKHRNNHDADPIPNNKNNNNTSFKFAFNMTIVAVIASLIAISMSLGFHQRNEPNVNHLSRRTTPQSPSSDNSSDSTSSTARFSLHKRSAVQGFVTQSNGRFSVNGAPLPPIVGWNIPQLVQIEDRPNELARATTFEIWDAIKSAEYSGSNVIRMYPPSVCCTKGVPDSRYYHVTAAQVLNETMMVAIDEALAFASQAGVRIIFPFIDWWSYRGGIAEFAALRQQSKAAFYTNSQLISDFEWLIKAIVLRKNTVTGILYRDDPTIFAWETGNELSLYESTPYPPGSWTLQIASFIKSIDSNHMVMDGTNGVSNGSPVWPALQSSGVLTSSSPVDIFTNHYYSCSGASDFSNRSISDSATVNAAGKAFLVGEYGGASQSCFQSLLTTITNAGATTTGALIWSLRTHAKDGGFYRHNEGSHSWWSYHVPGFQPTTNLYTSADEIDTVALIRNFAAKSIGLSSVPVISFAHAPWLFPISSPKAISWQGSPFATEYEVWRTLTPPSNYFAFAEWNLVGTVSDAKVFGSALFSDSGASCGNWYSYSIRALTEGG